MVIKATEKIGFKHIVNSEKHPIADPGVLQISLGVKITVFEGVSEVPFIIVSIAMNRKSS